MFQDLTGVSVLDSFQAVKGPEAQSIYQEYPPQFGFNTVVVYQGFTIAKFRWNFTSQTVHGKIKN